MALDFEMIFVLKKILSAQWRTFFLFLIIQVAAVASDCQFGSNRYVTIRETATIKDGPLIRITGSNSEVRFDVYSETGGSYRSFSNYFTISKVPGSSGRDNFVFYLKADINLDWVRNVSRLPNGRVVMTVKFRCLTRSGDNLQETFSYFYITVLPVDNNPPVIQPDALINVREDQPVGAPFANLRQIILDNDFPDTTVLKSCYITRNPNNKFDGSGVFAVSNNGFLRPTVPLDYEAGARMYQLNVTTRNNLNQKANGIVTIEVLNVNDNPVRFVYKGCVSQCHYVLMSSGNHQDPAIRATDADNDTIEYSITKVSPASETGIMVINKTTATIRQIYLCNDQSLQLLTLTIKAKATSTLPIGKNKSEISLNQDFATVKIYMEAIRQSKSGSDRVLAGGLFLPLCLIMIYGIAKSVI